MSANSGTIVAIRGSVVAIEVMAQLDARRVRGDRVDVHAGTRPGQGGRGHRRALADRRPVRGRRICQDIVAAGGTIANIGVHGVKADLHLETLWSTNITITTRRVDTVTIPMLLNRTRRR